jgi:hypothetical protein
MCVYEFKYKYGTLKPIEVTLRMGMEYEGA